ncbi:MAG: hypothetical protein IJH86_09155 [Clostridia bacterium]|nr:hypothetical protein [Clostridia bacterium]
MFIIILAIYAVLSVGGLTLFKLGAQRALSVGVAGGILSVNISWLSLAGLAMYVCSFLIYMGLVSKIQLSYLTPISTGVIYTLTLAASMLIFHEPMSAMKLAGVLLVLCGIILMNIK